MNIKSIIVAILLCLTTVLVTAQEFTLQSNDLKGQLTNTQVFKGFGCDGENISPQLSWSNAPEGTKSFAVTVYDPDAPTGSGWWHWIVFNLPSDTKELLQNAGNVTKGIAPKGSVQSRTDFGATGFGGACPPEGHGFHGYIFTVYALDVEKLDLDENAPAGMVNYFIGAHTLKKASVISYYKR